ncbi:acyl--CoA ligase [Fibrella sp. USSR17]
MMTNFFGCLYDKLLENAAQELIVWPEAGGSARAYTGAAILERVSVIRHELTERGIHPGQSVMLAMPVSFDLICSLLAIMAQGAVPVLPPANASRFDLVSLLKQTGIRGVMVQKAPGLLLAGLARLLRLQLVPVAPLKVWSGTYLPPQLVDPEQPALISHSSGSTGKPKAIRRSHRVLTAQHYALSASFPPWVGQRDFPLFPNILLHNLAVGTVSVLPDLPGFSLARMNPARIVAQLVRQQVHTLTGNVYYFQHLLRYLNDHPAQITHVRAVGIGGSPVPDTLIHSLQPYFPAADLFVIYGSSEAEPIAVRNTRQQSVTPRSGYPVGTVHPAIQVTIRPEGLLTLPNGTSYIVGEIQVRGDHVASNGNDWLATGDFGYIDKTDQLILTGRRGNERIHQGVQHYQIEHMLSAVTGVERVAARSGENDFTIYVQGTATEAAIRYVLDQHFPAGICPTIQFRAELPVDARHLSKIRYKQLS